MPCALTISFQAQQLGRLANEAGVAMAHASQGQNGGGHLKAFAEVSAVSKYSIRYSSQLPLYY